MNRSTVRILSLAISLVGSLSTADEKKSGARRDPYAYLFSFPPKVTPNDKQKEMLAGLREKYEPYLRDADGLLTKYPLDVFAGISSSASKRRLVRKIERERNGLLTEQQKEAAGLTTFIPAFATDKGLRDEKVWDLTQLEKLFELRSRSYDPDERIISFVVVTKRKWTDEERRNDVSNWTSKFTKKEGLLSTGVQAHFWNKNEEGMGTLDAAAWFRGLTRTPLKLTDKEAENGLLRYRIRIDLSDAWHLKDAATVKFIYPVPK